MLERRENIPEVRLCQLDMRLFGFYTPKHPALQRPKDFVRLFGFYTPKHPALQRPKDFVVLLKLRQNHYNISADDELVIFLGWPKLWLGLPFLHAGEDMLAQEGCAGIMS